jgi:hypothetical protein
MNWISLVGIFLVALGTGLTLYGGALQSKKDSEAVQGKVTTLLKRIDAAEGMAAGPEARSELQAIRGELANWTERFQSSRASRKMEREQTLLAQQTASLQRSLPARQIIGSAVEVIRTSASALSERTNPKIETRLPPVPADLFTERWTGSLRFGDQVTWEMQTIASRDEFVVLTITPSVNQYDAARWGPIGDFRLSVLLNEKSPRWETRITGDYFAPRDGIEAKGSMPGDFSTPLTNALRSLLELQVVILDSAASPGSR